MVRLYYWCSLLLFLGAAIGPLRAAAYEDYGGMPLTGALNATGAEPAVCYTLTTTCCRITTDLNRAEMEEIGAHLDAAYRAYLSRFPGLTATQVGQPCLYILASRSAFLRLLASKGINGAGAGGYFVMGFGIVICADGRSLASLITTARHEMFHAVLRAKYGRDIPKWANEGLAVYFADGLVRRADMVTGVASLARVQAMKARIAAHRYIPLERFLNLTADHWPVSDWLDLYEQAWSVVQFLAHGAHGKYVTAFADYLQQTADHGDTRKAFAAFHTDYATMEREWIAYFANLDEDPETRALGEVPLLITLLTSRDAVGVQATTIDDLYAALAAKGMPALPKGHSALQPPADAVATALIHTEVVPSGDEAPPMVVIHLPHATARLIWKKIATEGGWMAKVLFE